jgi:succinyl-CoA synthetase beta subunit
MVLAGGRGKGHFANGFQGGVHLCETPGEVRSKAVQMLGQRLITKQTGPKGLPCNVLYITERCPIATELYFSILLGRESMGPVLVASKHGGMNIEEVAEESPDAVVKVPVDMYSGPTSEQLDAVVEAFELEGTELNTSAREEIKKMYDFFIKYDCTQIEINPLVSTTDGRILALDAKCNFDDNAEFRQKTVFNYRDYSQEDPREVAAAEKDINYIGLEGNIGCLVNGAGLVRRFFFLLFFLCILTVF